MTTLVNTAQAKTILIDHLLHSNREINVIGLELRFAVSTSSADLVVVVNNRTQAFEIKGPKDDCRRLEKQMLEYVKVFDYVSVFLHDKHDISRLSIPSDIGILKFSDFGKISVVRKPKLQKNQIALEILHSIPIKNLKKYFPAISAKNQIRKEISKIYSLEIIRKIWADYVRNKYSTSFTLFHNEKGMITTLDDILNLSPHPHSEIQ